MLKTGVGVLACQKNLLSTAILLCLKLSIQIKKPVTKNSREKASWRSFFASRKQAFRDNYYWEYWCQVQRGKALTKKK